MDPHHNNLINAFLVNAGIRPASLLQQIDYKNIEDSYYTLSRIKELFPELYHIPNYQGIIISKTNIIEPIDTCEKMGYALGYPCSDEFNQIINEQISGYIIELICDYYNHGKLYTTILIANRCITPYKINEFIKLVKEATQYIGYQFDDIELVDFIVNYEKIYNTNEILNHVYRNKKINSEIIYHIGNIIWNMGIIDDNEIMNMFHYHKKMHRYIIIGFLWLDIFLDKYNIILPDFTLKPLKCLLKKSLNIF